MLEQTLASVKKYVVIGKYTDKCYRKTVRVYLSDRDECFLQFASSLSCACVGRKLYLLILLK